MKIPSWLWPKGMRATGGPPNLQFYLVTAVVLWISIINGSAWPILIWGVFCLFTVPLSRYLQELSRKQDQQKLTDHDPYIQDNQPSPGLSEVERVRRMEARQRGL